MSTPLNDIRCRISTATNMLEFDALAEEIKYAILTPDERGEMEDALASAFDAFRLATERSQLPPYMANDHTTEL